MTKIHVTRIKDGIIIKERDTETVDIVGHLMMMDNMLGDAEYLNEGNKHTYKKDNNILVIEVMGD